MTVEFTVTGDDPAEVARVEALFVAVLALAGGGEASSHEEKTPPPPVPPATVTGGGGGNPLVGLSSAEVMRLREFIAADQGSPLPMSHLGWRADNKPDEIRHFLTAMREAEREAEETGSRREWMQAAEKFTEAHGYGLFRQNGDAADLAREVRKQLMRGEVTYMEAVELCPPPPKPHPDAVGKGFR